MEELSLVLKNPHEGEFLEKIEWNKDEVTAMVESIVKRYTGAVYTEDQISFAKSDRAKLNAMKKAFSDRRIEVKNAVMAPYFVFEKEVKEVVSLIEKPIGMIDRQLKEYDDRVKGEKLQAIKDFFSEIATDLDGVLKFEQVYDKRYLNVSFSMKKAKEDIQKKVDAFRADMETIEGICDKKFVISVKAVYMETLDISKALAEEKKLKEIDKRMEEEQERKAAEAASMQQESVTKQADCMDKQEQIATERKSSAIEMPNPAPPKENTLLESEKKFKSSFTVYGTKAQIMGLKQYMVDNGIEFGKVE